MGSPLISLIIPTTGKEKNLFRCLHSLINHAPPTMLERAEVVVFLNPDPLSPIDYSRIESRLETIRARFLTLKIVRSERFELTAEESAYSASAYAEGDFIWLVGDKRIFLPEGLRRLASWLEKPTAPAAYFNSSWIDQNGKTNSHPSTHMLANQGLMPYKQFVMSTGINFIATGMGTWIFERKRMDRTIWKHLIDNCGPHFSHVTTTLATLHGETMQYFSTFLSQIESKAYHTGDDSEWRRYSSLAKTYRFYAWTFGLIRQFNFLIDRGAYDHADVRRSMCSEGTLLRRQVDELYSHLVAQIRYGWFKKEEKMTSDEFDEAYDFLCRTCPEKAIANEMLRELYLGCETLKEKEFVNKLELIFQAIGVDNLALRFGSLVVNQMGDRFIRLHPRGYVVSDVKDNENFLLAYKLIDAPAIGPAWEILSQEEIDTYQLTDITKRLGDIYPVHVMPGAPQGFLRNLTRSMVVRFYRHRIAFKIAAALPGKWKSRLKARLI
ncbi:MULTISPECIES: hypothetical protein [Paraburkholderia]|uniref:hypothetical protein n=1 Tax=Paraburkholderia TaxID=1822464 RepID=UPI0022573FD9|nr:MULTISPECIES: hypothetical protein [Paraburkholderia]MCX4159964.1 hypothetical protein [Paraburkholderia megapolitana]MDN7155464.1 glycosyltransferase [Paraburkholderia sp. CHISQ3]MDQ6492508.1 glycosyltransferase [Paraburkholderia megapolitana]